MRFDSLYGRWADLAQTKSASHLRRLKLGCILNKYWPFSIKGKIYTCCRQRCYCIFIVTRSSCFWEPLLFWRTCFLSDLNWLRRNFRCVSDIQYLSGANGLVRRSVFIKLLNRRGIDKILCLLWTFGWVSLRGRNLPIHSWCTFAEVVGGTFCCVLIIVLHVWFLLLRNAYTIQLLALVVFLGGNCRLY